MTYKMFIDDERWPAQDPSNWIIVRTPTEFVKSVVTNGMPNFISFDHDLGDNVGTGYDIVKLIVELDMATDFKLPDDFSYDVHSQNPIGRANIIGLLDAYIYNKGSFYD